MEEIAGMTMGESSLLTDLLAAVEDLSFEAERAKLQWSFEKEQMVLARYRANRSKVAFLKAVNAQPLDLEEYEAWLSRYIAAGGRLQRYREGSYPRPLNEQASLTSFFRELAQQSGIEVGSLEEDYYTSDVIWRVSEPLTFEELPSNLQLGAELTLLLTRDAMTSFDGERLAELDAQSYCHVYTEGMWRAGSWLNQPGAWNAPVSVWEENLTNLRQKCEKEG